MTRIGRDNAADFLQLSAEESALMDIRLSLAQAAKQSRVQHALSQTELAKRMKSSQSGIGKNRGRRPQCVDGFDSGCAAGQWS
jgi:ribosome-binding protein aMBF1 (putative translation factor)